MRNCQSSHTPGTRRRDTCLICAFHNPEKVLAGSEDLRDQRWMGGPSVKQGQAEKLASLPGEEAEAPGSS